AGRVRRRPRLLLRGLERRALPRPRPAGPLRAEQCVLVYARRAARPALPVAQPAGQAGQRAGGRGVRRGGGHPPRLAALRTLDRGGAQRREQATLLDPGGLRPRLPGAVRARTVQLPLHRPLRQGRRRRRALERRRPGGGLARGRAAAVGQGRQRAVPGAEPGRAAAGVPGMRLLVVGANGQVGRELRRSLAELGQVLPATRDGRLDDGTACAVADLGDPDGLARLVRDTTPDAVVNAAAYTAVDKAEDEPDVAWRINAQAPGVLAR